MNLVEKYIDSFTSEVRELLIEIRRVIRELAPDAVEGMAYGMPGYKLNQKPLVYFAGYKKHIGFYATPSGHKQFKKELSRYKQGKGSVQFPISEPLPVDLIKKIVECRVQENKKA